MYTHPMYVMSYKYVLYFRFRNRNYFCNSFIPPSGGGPFVYPPPGPTKITFTYNSVLTVIPVSFCTAYNFVTFRVRVSFRVRVRVQDR